MGLAIKMDNKIETESPQNHGSAEPMRKGGEHRMALRFAGTIIGQAILMPFDKLLWSLEKTATWISNNKTGGRKGKASVSLVRPLPWIFFLPTLIILRYVRIVCSLVAICLGFEEIEGSKMVQFLHNSRRNLHKLREDSVEYQHSNKNSESAGCAFLSKISTIYGWLLEPRTRVQNNKSSLDVITDEALETDASMFSSGTSGTDTEDEAYKYLLTRDMPDTESDDDDFVCDKSIHPTSASSDGDGSYFEEREVAQLQAESREIIFEMFTTNGNHIKAEEPKENGEKVEVDVQHDHSKSIEVSEAATPKSNPSKADHSKTHSNNKPTNNHKKKNQDKSKANHIKKP